MRVPKPGGGAQAAAAVESPSLQEAGTPQGQARKDREKLMGFQCWLWKHFLLLVDKYMGQSMCRHVNACSLKELFEVGTLIYLSRGVHGTMKERSARALRSRPCHHHK